MHPIERLRHVARAETALPSVLVREAAEALAALGPDHGGLVTACRRLVDRHPAVGPMWSLAARVLAAADPGEEPWRVADEVDADPTARLLAGRLPEEAAVVLVGWPEQAAAAVRRRADVEALVVHAGGASAGLSRRLRAAGLEVHDVPDAGVAAAVAAADLVLVEATAMGPAGLLAAAGSHAAAAVARCAGVPVWAVAGTARALPPRLWDAALARCEAAGGRPWDREVDVVPLVLCDEVVGPRGAEGAAGAASRADCPVAPELLKAVG